MSVNLDKMLERCQREQWTVADFDWSGAPIALSPEREREICAYYVNMSYIERLAGALFLALARRVDDPTLAAIFTTFHADELRHSHAAARLADYFDVHHYRVYTPNVPMLRFIPSFVDLIESVGPAYATNFILGGELILDIALLAIGAGRAPVRPPLASTRWARDPAPDSGRHRRWRSAPDTPRLAAPRRWHPAARSPGPSRCGGALPP
jgi:hypothetical protein